MLKLTKLRCNLLSVKFIKIFLKHFKIIKYFSATRASSTCPDRAFVPSLDIYIVAACCFLCVSRLLWLRLPLLVLRFLHQRIGVVFSCSRYLCIVSDELLCVKCSNATECLNTILHRVFILKSYTTI
jgi:hypothetical protein